MALAQSALEDRVRSSDRETEALSKILMRASDDETRELILIVRDMNKNMHAAAQAMADGVSQMREDSEKHAAIMEGVLDKLADIQEQENIRRESQKAVKEYKEQRERRVQWFIIILVTSFIGAIGYSVREYGNFRDRMTSYEVKQDDIMDELKGMKQSAGAYRRESTDTMNRIDRATDRK